MWNIIAGDLMILFYTSLIITIISLYNQSTRFIVMGATSTGLELLLVLQLVWVPLLNLREKHLDLDLGVGRESQEIQAKQQ